MRPAFFSAFLFAFSLHSPIEAQRPLGDEFQVNTYTTFFQDRPGLAVNANGDFVVAWRSYHDGDGTGVFGQRFGSDGSPVGRQQT